MKLLRLAVLLVAVGLLAGCGGSDKPASNGVAAKTADEIIADVDAATKEATSVYVHGSGTSDGTPIELDLHIVANEGGAGSVLVGELEFEMVRIGDQAYFKGGDDFWQQFGGDAAAELLRGRWLSASATTGDFASFTSLTDLAELFTALLGDHGALEKGEETTVGDAPAIGVTDKSDGGILYVATTGKAYPLQVTGGPDNPGTIVFESWDEPYELTAPESPIDISKLKQ